MKESESEVRSAGARFIIAYCKARSNRQIVASERLIYQQVELMAGIAELTSIPIHRFDLLPNLIHRIGVILNLFSRRLLIAAGHESNEEQKHAFADFS